MQWPYSLPVLIDPQFSNHSYIKLTRNFSQSYELFFYLHSDHILVYTKEKFCELHWHMENIIGY